VRDLFDYPTIRELAAHIDQLGRTTSTLTTSDVTNSIPMTSVTETAQPVPTTPSTLHDLFLTQVSRRAKKPAVLTADRAITYKELDELSLDLAKMMRGTGLVAEGRVAVAMDKGWEQVVAMLAVVRAGGAYVPIDMSLPDKRRDHILNDCGASIVLTQSWLRDRLTWPDNITVVAVDEFSRIRPVPTPAGLNWTVNDSNLAVVIYTSGTTGVPKGVLLEHAGLVNTIRATIDRYDVGPTDRALGLTSIHHDLSIFDVFGMLAAGGAIVVPDDRLRRDPSHWLALIRQHRVSVWNSVPASLAMMMEYNRGIAGAIPSSIRLFFLGGDWIPVTMPDAIWSDVPHADITSIGGPTEGSLWSTLFDIEAVNSDWKSIPYGKAIPGTGCLIVDDRLEEVVPGEVGELCLTGICVARGYLNNPAKTEAVFVRHPLTGERMYRTGDLGRLMQDGNIELLGRADLQINIDGYRIELQEIEAVLVNHDAISAAVVTASRDELNRPALTAHIVRASPVASEALKVYLQHELPAPMVPGIFSFHDALPLTPNGKVDRIALGQQTESTLKEDIDPISSATTRPAPVEKDVGQMEQKTHVSNQNVRETVNLIWRELLKLDQDVTGEADFFGLGGHSLLALMFISRVRERLGVELSVTSIFDHPTFDEICNIVESSNQPDDQIEIRI
jgi:pyochelin synthetase